MADPSNGTDDFDDLITQVRFALRKESWMELAQCKIEGVPTKEFFPIRGTSQKTARACCARCQVAEECRDYADRSGTEWGIWGGEIRRRGPWPEIDGDYWDDFVEPKKVTLSYDDLD